LSSGSADIRIYFELSLADPEGGRGAIGLSQHSSNPEKLQITTLRVRGVAMDKRRHPRLHLKVPIRFVLEQPETQDFQEGEGILKDISTGGMLIKVEPPLPVEPGNIREFLFFLIPENAQQCDLAHFQAQGLVLRLDPPDPNSSAYGMAVQFLSALTKKDVTITMTISSRRRIGPRPEPTSDEP